MPTTESLKSALVVATLTASGLALAPSRARAHCDTLDGPVVRDARAALEAEDVSPALKWVEVDRESEVRQAFAQAQAVRGLGPEAQALADRFFLETLVRVHREGEGAPYTGLKPAGTAIDPAIAASDDALDTDSAEPLVALITGEVDRGLRARHARAVEARRHAEQSVEDGREFVAAYVELTHYAERLLAAARSGLPAHETEHAH